MIRLTSYGALVEGFVPLTIRPFIAGKIRTAEALDDLIGQLRKVADQHPVVNIEFDRNLTETITRIHSILDPQKSLIRCYPLTVAAEEYERLDQHAHNIVDKDLTDFVREAFSDDAELEGVALALVDNGDENADSIIGQFVENNTVSI